MSKLVPNNRITNALAAEGFSVVAGVDEVGRGCLAGPVTAAAVILPDGIRIRGARDSKLLTVSARMKLARRIRQQALAIGIGWASHAEIDQHGLTWAVKQSGLRALAGMGRSFDAVILDGKHNYLSGEHYARPIVRADQSCLNVACASIIAKVARDRYMEKISVLYPEFMFHRNKGYGTLWHRRALQRQLTPIHRRRYLPVRLAELSRVD